MGHTSVLHTETLESQGTCGLVAMTSASHAEGRQFDPGQVYFLLLTLPEKLAGPKQQHMSRHKRKREEPTAARTSSKWPGHPSHSLATQAAR